MPKPPGEVDFETWCLHVKLMFQDGLPTDMQRRMILESLLSPASDILKQLGSHSPPHDYVRLLQSASTTEQRHFGSTKVKPSLQLQCVPEATLKSKLDGDILQKYITETESLRKQVAELQVHLTEKRAQRRKKRAKDSNSPRAASCNC